MGFSLYGREIKKIGVVGSGQIGPDVALHFATELARHGVSICVVDIEQEALERGKAKIAGKLEKGVSKKRMRPESAQQIRDAIEFSLDYGALEGAQFIVEAATEEEAVKHKIFDDLHRRCPDAILASNSSHMLPEVIFKDVKESSRCVGIHYFFPADQNALVEIIPASFTSRDLVKSLMRMYESIGKVPIKVRSRYGYAVDPVFEGLFLAAALIVEEGIATTRQVDFIACKCLGLKAGPFTAMNLTGGNAITRHGLDGMHETVMPWFKAPAILKEKVSSGEAWDVPDRDEQVEVDARTFDTVAALLQGAYFGLAAQVLQSGITNIGDLELALETGLGIKPPFKMMNKVGIDRALELVLACSHKYDGFQVAAILKKQAAEGKPWSIPVVLRESHGDFAVVTIRRPRVLNALDPDVIEQLGRVFKGIEADEKVKGVVLTGFGQRAFVAGADINRLAELASSEEGERFALEGQEVLNRIEDLSKPVVCAMNGLAFGGGNELAMACHARIAKKGLKVLAGQPEPKLGIIPGYGGTQRLPRWVGMEKAWPLLRNGNPVSSAEALGMGLILEEVEGDLVEAAFRLLDQVVSGKLELDRIPAGAIEVPEQLPDVDIGPLSRKIDGILCKAVLDGATMTLREGLKHEARMFGDCLNTKDTRIGLENFIKNGPKVPAGFVHE